MIVRSVPRPGGGPPSVSYTPAPSSQPVNTHCNVTAILVAYGLPRLLTVRP